MNKIRKVLLLAMSLITTATLLTACQLPGANSGTQSSTASTNSSVGGGTSEEPHTHDYTKLMYDVDGHWYECSCGDAAEKTAHSGGEATCEEKAVCETCEQAYGAVGSHNHTELK